MDKIKPSEVSEILLQQLNNIGAEQNFDEVGTVLTVNDGVARIYGLKNAEANELLEFEPGELPTAPLRDMNKMSERCLVSKASAKVLQFFHICKFSCKFFRIIYVFRPFFLILTIECSYITEKMITFAHYIFMCIFFYRYYLCQYPKQDRTLLMWRASSLRRTGWKTPP